MLAFCSRQSTNVRPGVARNPPCREKRRALWLQGTQTPRTTFIFFGSVSIMCSSYSWTSRLLLLRKLRSHAHLLAWFAKSLLSWHNCVPSPQHHYWALFTFQTYGGVWFKPASPTTMLGSRDQQSLTRRKKFRHGSWYLPVVVEQPRTFHIMITV